MKLATQHTSVLIVGAGPSGLMMAAQLLRYGIQPIIIDDKKGPTDQSRALAVQARSLEIYRQMGVSDRVLNEGKKALGVDFSQEGKLMAGLSLSDMGDQQTLFPFLLMYPQSKNERLLLDFLTQNCCPVYWDTSLISFNQQEKHIDVVLKNAGEEIGLSCDWLIGADGAHSTVRKQLGIPFNGDTYQHGFYLADITLEHQEDDHIHLFLSDSGFAAFFLMPEDRRYRIVGSLPPELSSIEKLTLGDIEPHLKNITKNKLGITECHWFTTYRLHHRMAGSFNNQRSFLIGDSAHIHSPVGGQGMNTGLQDAYNLAWKLAGAINGQYNPALLDSYAAERMPVARELLKTTDRAFNFILSDGFWAGILKKWLLPSILKKVWGNAKLRKTFFTKISQIGINYRDSKINLHLSQSTKIKAGDRLPYLTVFDEKKLIETDLHEWCSKPGFTFIAMGQLSEGELFRLARWITQNYPGTLNFFYLPPSNKNRHVFNEFEVTARQQKTLIVRPDMYIGFINDGVDMVKIDSYMKNVVGMVK
ncbi:FAD-dependent monooxygenase [Mucilaginibacter paludis]|uniref:Monooxygenase FAD-binding n=1 Tax=Mucilaginibacter paludis DSM 18603 TaxID=714943 RepID=H1XZU2_9SPHI|nr:FAD-dependent monooxygenase [Mucilaginibacter paludis]EHQ27784.1 monooxygenase FAD-binding [Mucilaginibacter paludis DSM 18603]